MVQYQGWLALLWRAKAIRECQARVVFEGDEFDISYGSTVNVHHKPTFKTNKAQLYYATALPARGTMMLEAMSLDQVKEHAKQYARGLDKKDSPWNTAFDEMAKKTVLRKLIKLLPLQADTEIVAALKADEEIWESDKEGRRMDTWKQVTAAPDVPSEDDKIIAYKQYSDAVENAKKHKIDITDLPQVDRNDVQRLRAITDSIVFRCESIPVSQGKS